MNSLQDDADRSAATAHAFAKGDSKVASQLWSSVSAGTGQFAEACDGLARCLLREGRNWEALALLEQAVDLAPNIEAFYFHLGVAYQRLGVDIEAAKAYRKANQLNPAFSEAILNLGQLMLRHGNPKGANDCFEKAAELPNRADESWLLLPRSPDRPDYQPDALGEGASLSQLGIALGQLGRFAESEQILEKFLELFPLKASVYYRLVHQRRVSNQDSALVQRMEKTLEIPNLLNLDRANVHYALGKAHEDLKRFEPAMKHFDLANSLMIQEMRSAGVSFKKEGLVQAVDRMIAVFTAEFFSRPPFRGSSSEVPVLIVGMPRAGTTLTNQILTSHPEIAGGQELGFWREKGLPAAYNVQSLGQAQADRLADEFLDILKSIGNGKSRITDKMPQNFMALGIFHAVFPEARIVHVRRHAVDNALSLYTTPFQHPMAFNYTREDLVFFFRQYERLMAHWRQVLPSERLTEVNYQDLVDDLEPHARRLIQFCGLEWAEACLHPEENTRTVKTASLWQVRQPVYRSSVEKWKNYEPWLGELRQLL